MIKNSINKILWHVVRYECLVGIEILKYEFWPFLQQTGKKLVTAITFAYDVEITQIICQKNREKNPSSNPPGFTRSAIHRFLKFQKKKKLFQTDDFSQQNQKNSKNSKKLKNSKIPKKTQKCITKKIVDFSWLFYFLDFFWIF
jgi:hypothetical protein